MKTPSSGFTLFAIVGLLLLGSTLWLGSLSLALSLTNEAYHSARYTPPAATRLAQSQAMQMAATPCLRCEQSN